MEVSIRRRRSGPSRLRRGDLRRPVPDRPRGAPGRSPPAAGGCGRRLPPPRRSSPWRSLSAPASRPVAAPVHPLPSRWRCWVGWWPCAPNDSRRATSPTAHRLEVEILGLESGIQDQLSAAIGGINYLEIEHVPGSHRVSLADLGGAGARLTLVFLGRAHDSSEVHRQVIEECKRGSRLLRLRDAAAAARDAVLARDLGAFGQSMIANTEAQGSLHPELVGVDARRVIEIARATGRSGGRSTGPVETVVRSRS